MTRWTPTLVALGLLAAMLGFAPPAATPAAPAPPAAASADPSLVVMSFNIRYGTANDGDNAWPKRKPLVIDRIRESKADIVGLQEALKYQIDEILAAMPEYTVTGVGRDDGKEAGEYSAILYRSARLTPQPPFAKAVESDLRGTFWLSDTPNKPGSTSWGNRITRICSWVRLRDTKSDQSFLFLNTHFDHESQPSREKSSHLLKERAALLGGPDPVIITGDFNAGESNPAIVALLNPDGPTSQGVTRPPLRDSFRVLHPDEREVGTFNNFKNNPPFQGDKIDYIFVDDRWDVLEAAIDRTMPDGRCPSDHFPVIARLRLKPAAPANAPTPAHP